MQEKFLDFLVDALTICFFPMVCMYHTLTSDIFFNVAVQTAPPIERLGDALLTPLQYLCDGKVALPRADGSWELVQHFNYSHGFWPKTVSAAIALPFSVPLGTLVKAVSFCSSETRKTYASLKKAHSTPSSQSRSYEALGVRLQEDVWSQCQGHKRRPGDAKRLEPMVHCLSEIAHLFNQAKLAWWVDCATCLGVYRYGGVIPWDNDLDIAILSTDFEDAKRILTRLDPTKYLVQDWSSRDIPNSWLKVYIRDSKQLIDIYCYHIDLAKKELSYIFPLEYNLFFPEWWKIRERHYKTPTPIAHLFPLQKGKLDGVEVFVPREMEQFLQRYYGENLAPARLYDEISGRYEKDLSHPYWLLPQAH